MPQPLKILVLHGGPDRERPVSLLSGQNVASALQQAGHDVRLADITPDHLQPLDDFATWPGDLIFPVLHGAWGEGGPLQSILENRQLPFVGCTADAARLCMDKTAAKARLLEHQLPTPRHEELRQGQRRTLPTPLVIKPPCEGSSIDLIICKDESTATRQRSRLHRRHERLLLEQFIPGSEITVGVIQRKDSIKALPPIHIVPATEFYDYQAKYERDDTQYLFDVPAPMTTLLQDLATRAFVALGCRHLTRIDFIVDAHHQPWILEANTIPGFTSHSLLPMAAAREGLNLAMLTDHLARLAVSAT